jgi:hypothetical protein
MFDWLSSRLKKNDGDAHPLTTEAGLRQLLDEATVGSANGVLRTLAETLEDLTDLEDRIDPEARIRATLGIDERAREFLPLLWDQLFPPLLRTLLPDDVWLILASYYRHSALAASAALAVFPKAELETSSGRKQFALLSLIALQSRYGHEKLQRFRYRPAEPGLWQDYAKLYRDARKWGVNAQPVKVPGDAEKEVALQTVLLRALMLEVAPLENLAPEQIECLDRLLARDAAMLTLKGAADERSPFVFAEGPPSRFDATRPPVAEALFFGPGLAYNDLQRVHAALEKNKPVDWLDPAPGTPAQKLALFALLKDCWSDTPPHRQSPREPSEGKLLVVHGFTQVRRMVAAASFARSGRQLSLYSSYQSRTQSQEEYFGSVAEEVPEENNEVPLTPLQVLQKLELAGDRDQMEQWIVADRSSQGMGLVVPQQKRWLKIGSLLGFRRKDAMQWELAVIRRLGRNIQSQRVAGLLLFPGLAEPVSLRPLKEGESIQSRKDSLADFCDGILLSPDERTLLLEADLGQVDDRYLLLAHGRRHGIRVEEVLESRDDFTLVRYRSEPSDNPTE